MFHREFSMQRMAQMIKKVMTCMETMMVLLANAIGSEGGQTFDNVLSEIARFETCYNVKVAVAD